MSSLEIFFFKKDSVFILIFLAMAGLLPPVDTPTCTVSAMLITEGWEKSLISGSSDA